MDISPKAIRFIVEALKHYEEYHCQRMQEVGLSDDDMADLGNDRQFLAAIRQDLESYHNRQMHAGEHVPVV